MKWNGEEQEGEGRRGKITLKRITVIDEWAFKLSIEISPAALIL